MDSRHPTAIGLVAAVGVVALATSDAFAQFGTPGSTNVRERLVGAVVLDEGAPTLGEGDQLGAFFNDELVGVFSFTGEEPSPEYELTIFGDDPDTPDLVEGPSPGDGVEFRFFDDSRNAVISEVAPLNEGGETVNYAYAGENIPPLPGGFPVDVVPVRELDMRIGDEQSGDGGGNDGNEGSDGGGDNGGGGTGGSPDVNRDGEVTTDDAVIVLRFVSGAGRSAGVPAAQADANGDGSVTVADAIFVLRNRDG
jgi:hypothetical protein